jgi:hypothetical protein
MRFFGIACLAACLAGAACPPAAAQSDNAVVVPPAPPIVATPPATLPPQAASPPPSQVETTPSGLVQTPTPPANADSGTGTASTAAPDDSLPPQLPSSWVSEKTADLGVLNKVDGSTSSVAIPVGGQANIGDLTVSVMACVTRPPDQIPDAAIFVAAQSAAADNGTPAYRGWMVRSAPGAAVVGDASETFRVIGCS